MQIVRYQNKYKNDFIKLNTAWIEKFFVMEPADVEMLNNAEELLKKGAMIFFALENEKVISTCMVIPLEKNIWEIAKLATDENSQGKGAGRAVFDACVDYAVKNGAEKIIIISNHILKPALNLYEKSGFTRVNLDRQEYSRADVQYELQTKSLRLKKAAIK